MKLEGNQLCWIPKWNQGRYLELDQKPENGLSVARMIAHITYLSEKAFQNKFGRNLQEKKGFVFWFWNRLSSRELSSIPGTIFC